MRVPASPYSVLELEPGADRAAIEEAYRRLIKRYHPDRSGGDAERAAEINRAYFELRQQHEGARFAQEGFHAARPVPVQRAVRPRPIQRRSGRRRSFLPLLVLALAILVLVQAEPLSKQASGLLDGLADAGAPVLAPRRGSAVQVDSALLDGPLNEPAVESALTLAVSLAQRGQEQQLAQQSRACHARMRREPELAQLDRCAALDNAAAILVQREPFDSGAFSASAVTARHVSAANLLSSDFLAIERRLDRIRTAVELAIMPRAPPLPPPPLATQDEPQTVLLPGDPVVANGF